MSGQLAPVWTPGGTMTDPASDTGDLWRWVDRLTRDRRQRLVRKPPGGKPRVEYVDVPSLWTQLVDAEASNNTGGGHGKAGAGSRSPVHLEVVALLTEITDYVVDALKSHGAAPRLLADDQPDRAPGPSIRPLRHPNGKPVIEPDLAGRLVEHAARPRADQRYRQDLAQLRHDTRSDLRQLAALVVSYRDPADGAPSQDLIDWWADRYRWWVARAETALATEEDGTPELRPVRGLPCPTCGAEWVERVEPSYDPRATDGLEHFHDPALVIAFRDGQVQHITCRACDTGWWRGEDVDTLTLTQQLASDEAIHGRPRPPAAARQVAVGDYADRLRAALRAQAEQERMSS